MHVGVGLGQGLTPAETVEKYCRSDYAGDKLNYNQGDIIATETTLACYGVEECIESGYDTYIIINDYKIQNEVIGRDKASVEVVYDVVCEFSGDAVIFDYRIDREVVNLVKVNGEWRMQTTLGLYRVYRDSIPLTLPPLAG
jgi:hypothetical protein